MHSKYDAVLIMDAELLRCIEAVDEKKKYGLGQSRSEGKFGPMASADGVGRSALQTAKKLGIGQATVDRARVVLSDPEEKAAVLSGKKTIYQAWKDITERRLSAVLVQGR